MFWSRKAKKKPPFRFIIRRSTTKMGEFHVLKRLHLSTGWYMINVETAFVSEHSAEKYIKDELALIEWANSGKDIEFE